MQILDGKKLREVLLPALIEKVASFPVAPCLAIVQVGNRPDSTAFIKAKRALAEKIGVRERHVHLPENIGEEELILEIKKLNQDSEVTGIILQLPLPPHIDRDNALEAISPSKDADCLTSLRVKAWTSGKGMFPATPRGIRELFRYYKISLAGKKVALIGRSLPVGKPLLMMCLEENATVTVCHSKTPDIASITKNADIIISAAGKRNLIGRNCVKENQVIIDVGLQRGEDGKLRGDVDFDAVKDIVAAITPVPGGVGPMTVLSLFLNLVDLDGQAR